MDRLRIYVDTSVLGGCFDPEFVTWSEALIRDFRAKRLIPVLSDVTAAEIAAAPEAVRGRPLGHVSPLVQAAAADARKAFVTKLRAFLTRHRS